MQTREGRREGIPSRLRAVCAEPGVGLVLTNREIMTWTEFKSQAHNQLGYPGAPELNVQKYKMEEGKERGKEKEERKWILWERPHFSYLYPHFVDLSICFYNGLGVSWFLLPLWFWQNSYICTYDYNFFRTTFYSGKRPNIGKTEGMMSPPVFSAQLQQ